MLDQIGKQQLAKLASSQIATSLDHDDDLE